MFKSQKAQWTSSLLHIVKMLQKFLVDCWLIWSRAIDHHVGMTDEEHPKIPNLKVRDANISLIIRTLIVVINFITCGFIIANAIHHW